MNELLHSKTAHDVAEHLEKIRRGKYETPYDIWKFDKTSTCDANKNLRFERVKCAFEALKNIVDISDLYLINLIRSGNLFYDDDYSEIVPEFYHQYLKTKKTMDDYWKESLRDNGVATDSPLYKYLHAIYTADETTAKNIIQSGEKFHYYCSVIQGNLTMDGTGTVENEANDDMINDIIQVSYIYSGNMRN